MQGVLPAYEARNLQGETHDERVTVVYAKVD